MLFIWALLIGAATLGVLTYYWGVNSFLGGLLGVPFFYLVCWMIYESVKERDERERSGQQDVFWGFSWQPAAFLIANSTSGIHKCNLISQVAFTPYNARAWVLVLK